MELSDLLQHDQLRFCESSKDSDNSFDLVQLLSSTLDEYESQSGSSPASEIPAGVREFHRRLGRTYATVSECGMNGGWLPERETCGDTIPALSNIIPSNLQHWLNYFGSEYPPDSLHHLCSGIMCYLWANNCPVIDIFKDSDFTKLRATLDAEMKRLQVLGVGSKKRQTEPLTEEEEEVLWQKGLLGDHTPQALLNTMVFMNGLYSALRSSGNEHRNLCFSPCQIEVHDNEGEQPYLLHTEDLSKNHPGGLKSTPKLVPQIKPKLVHHYANIENPSKCFVTPFKRYTTLCPPKTSKNTFHLQPLRNPTPQRMIFFVTYCETLHGEQVQNV